MKAIITGRVVAKPVTRNVSVKGENREVTNFDVAINSYNPNGEERTEFARIACWGQFGSKLAANLDKGRMVYFEGDAQARHWTGRDNAIHDQMAVTMDNRTFKFLDARPKATAQTAPTGQAAVAHASQMDIGSEFDDLFM